MHWDCFTQCLASSDGGRIEIGHVLDYCTLYGIGGAGTRDELLRICRLLSDEFQEIKAERMKKQQKHAERGQKRAGKGVRRPSTIRRGKR